MDSERLELEVDVGQILNACSGGWTDSRRHDVSLTSVFCASENDVGDRPYVERLERRLGSERLFLKATRLIVWVC